MVKLFAHTLTKSLTVCPVIVYLVLNSRAAGENRTLTVLPPRDFKSLASTNSATAAFFGVEMAGLEGAEAPHFPFLYDFINIKYFSF